MSFINTVKTEDLYHKVARLIEDSRARMVTSINLAEVYTKFRIGQYIVEEEQRGETRAQYGKQVLQSLATKLTENFGNGWSYSNLRQMRQFFIIYSNLTTTGCQIDDFTPKFTLSWSHYLLLMRVEDPDALSRKLAKNPVFGLFNVVNVAGDGDEEEESRDALELVNKAIGSDPDQSYTITLSCGRLTTGVSVKPWTGVFMMAGAYSTSAAGYMQTIFRVQTPYTHNGRMKTDCYAFDFAPDRTLRVLAETAKVSHKAGKQTEDDRKLLGDFLNFCPIIAIDGGQMKQYKVETMLAQLKRAQIEKVVQDGFENGALYNDELLKLTDVELKEFDDLKGIIGKTKAMPKSGDIDINRQGLTNEQYEEKEQLEKKKKKDLTPEEKNDSTSLKQRATNGGRLSPFSVVSLSVCRLCFMVPKWWTRTRN